MVVGQVEPQEGTMPASQTLAAVDNAALVTGIQALAETLKGASSLDDVNTKAEDMLKQLTVYSE